MERALKHSQSEVQDLKINLDKRTHDADQLRLSLEQTNADLQRTVELYNEQRDSHTRKKSIYDTSLSSSSNSSEYLQMLNFAFDRFFKYYWYVFLDLDMQGYV